jgi:hypothetical protein
MSKKSSRTSVKGAIGFIYGGMLKGGTGYFFSTTDESEVNTVYENMKQYYGKNITCK